MLQDFTEEAPAFVNPIDALACSVSFTSKETNLLETERLCAEFKREMISMRPWYDMSVRRRGRTTVGVSGLSPEVLGDFICAFLGENAPENPRKDISPAYSLKLAADDLKAFYFEGITAQPGQDSLSSKRIADWFWKETLAAKVLLRVKKACLRSNVPEMRRVGGSFIVPSSQVRKPDR